ncbi:hypothetical protein VU08_03430 [Desulfobulbus sp. F5]|nr:hypothetical protein [Desulfobulbus sp. F5]
MVTTTNHHFFFKNAAEIAKGKSKSIYSVATFQELKMLWLTGNHQLSIDRMEILVNDNQDDDIYVQVYAEMLFLMDRHEEALTKLQKVLAFSDFQSLTYKMALLDLSLVYVKMGMYKKANFYIRLAQTIDSPRNQTMLCLLEQNIRADNQAQAEQTFNQLIKEFTWPDLMAMLEQPNFDYPTLPVSYSLVRQYAAQWLADQQQSP